MSEVRCANCDEPITSGTKRRYCDDVCRYAFRDRTRTEEYRARQNGIIQTCEACGTTYHGRKRRFCGSDDCERERTVEAQRRARANWTPERWEEERAKNRARPHNGRRPRVCEVCTTEYRPTYADQRTCGRECGITLRRRENGTAGSVALVGQSSDVPLASCAICREQHIVRGRTKRHCTEWPKAVRYCVECGNELPSNRTKYCKDECGKRAHKRHRRHLQRVALASLPRNGRKDPRGKFTECQECGGPLTGKQRKWCGPLCRDRAYNRHERHLARTAPHADLNEPVFTTWQIGQRDGWRCHLCKRKVDGVADGSMDHLVPIEHGGLHIPDNVALAHPLCNSLKGSSGESQLILSMGVV